MTIELSNGRAPDSPNRFNPLIDAEAMHDWGIRRHNANISRKEMAAKLGYQHSQIRRWEKGECCIPDHVCDAYTTAIREAEAARQAKQRVYQELRYKRVP